MHLTALEKGMSHSEVLMISQKLDEVINEFYKMSLVKKAGKRENRSKLKLGCKLDKQYSKCVK
jgi:hypothetical protein